MTDGKADDGSTDTTADDTITITVTVTDQNDPPQITGGSTSVSYAENGTGDVETYTATDPDTNSLTWTVTGTDSAFFSIAGGVLKFLKAPNFEAKPDAGNDNDYQVTVGVSDGTSADTVDVTVTVTDVNEKPQFPHTESGMRSVAENTASGGTLALR